MATYPIFLSPSFPYEDHLMYNEYTSEINRGIQSAAKDIVEGQALYTNMISDTLNKNSGMLSQVISHSADQLSDDISELSNVMNLGIDRLNHGIASLRSDFNICMGKVLVQFEIMRSEINAGLENIIYLLENRRKTDAQEHFRDAINFYNDGCRYIDKPQSFDDALRHFKASVEQYERNPLAHLHIAHIYHYQEQFRDFEKALEHYRLCYTYGEAEKKEHAIAAQGYFYAGWLHAAVFNNLSEAIKLTSASIDLDPKLAEGYYHLSKFYALNYESALAVKHLRYVIEYFDKNYCLKVCADPDFSSIHDDVKKLFSELKKNARQDFLSTLERELKTAALDSTIFTNISDSLEKFSLNVNSIVLPIKNSLKADSYFGYIDSMQHVKRLAKLKSNEEILFFKNIDFHMEEINFVLTDLKKLIANYVPKNEQHRTELEIELEGIDQLLKETKVEWLNKAFNKLKTVHGYNMGRWITLEAHKEKERNAQDALIKQKEDAAHKSNEEQEKFKNDEKVRRLKEKLCLSCGESLGLIDKIFGRKKCNQCR